MMMSYIALGFVGVAWALIVFSLAFAPGNDYVGDLSQALLRNVGLGAQSAAALIPQVLFMSYQGTFAIITAALISGAIVERMRFPAYTLFITLWAIVVYGPIAHWVWGGGWLAKMGALDFAGGTVVHVNAGVAALVAAIVIGPRKDFARQAILPHNVPFTLLGAGLLWFGWFGFNAGSAVAASPIAGLAFTTTFLAPMGTLVVWTLLDLLRNQQGDGCRRGHGHRRRPGRDHAGGRASSARSARWRSARSRRSRATTRCCGARARGSTIRSTSSPRTASAARSARC